MDSLFPRGEPDTVAAVEEEAEEEDDGIGEAEWPDECNIPLRELTDALKCSGKGNTAPGLDGLRKKILKNTPDEMTEIVRGGYSECLRKGWFPTDWRRAILVPRM